MTTPTRRPWLLEGLVIVLSILLAFGIQAWWDDLSEAREETRLLEAVASEVRANLKILEGEILYQAASVESSRAVLELAGAEREALSAARADTLIAETSWWSGVEWQTGAIDALTAGGQLSSISSEVLRYILISFPAQMAEVRTVEAQEAAFFADVFMPLVRREAWLPQISNALTARPGSTVPYPVAQLPAPAMSRDHRSLLLSDEFQNAILQKLWIHTDVLSEYEDFRAALEALLVEIEAEIPS